MDASRERQEEVSAGKGHDRSLQSETRLDRVLALLLRLGIIATILPFGSTGFVALNVSSLLLALVVTLVTLRGLSTDAGGWPAGLSAVIAALLGLYVFLQTGYGPVSVLPSHPIWAEASRIPAMLDLRGAASIDPAVSLAALPALLTPFLVFSACLMTIRNDQDAVAFLRFLAVCGGAVALFGLLQFGLAPGSLLLSTKYFYLDSFTGVFVNRNSAATYLGCTILLLLTLIGIEMRGKPVVATLAGLVLDRRGNRRAIWLKIQIFLLAATIVALFLTKSRAGIASTLLAILLLALLAAFRSPRPGEAGPAGLWRRLLPVVSATAILGVVVLVLGRQTIHRAEVRGLDDPRFCILPDILAAARDAWPYGTGLGTFAAAFQSYRNLDCGIYGTYDRAHQFFLEGLITLGAPMIAACLLVYATLLAFFVRGMIRRRRMRPVAALGLAVTALLTLHDLVDFSLQIPGIAVNAAAILGACVAVSRGFPQRSSRPESLPRKDI